jgi:hypothetical protein
MVRVDALVICRDGVDIISQSNGFSSVRITLLSGFINDLNEKAIRLCGHPLRCIDLYEKVIVVYQVIESPSFISWCLVDKVSDVDRIIGVLKSVSKSFLERHINSLDKSITELEG